MRAFLGASFAWPGAVEVAQKRINEDPASSSFEALFGSQLDGISGRQTLLSTAESVADVGHCAGPSHWRLWF